MSSQNCPLAIVGMSCLFPKADDLQAYWANIKNGVDAITPVPLGSHWNAADYFDADPKKPDHTYAQRGGFLSALHFNPMEFGMAPKDIEATDTSQLLGMVAAQKALADAGYATGVPGQVQADAAAAGTGTGTGRNGAAGRTAREFNRDRTSVILGVTGALELVIPLGARLGHPKWRKALKDAGVAQDIADDVVQRISDSYVGWQENSFPGLLGNVAAGRIASRLDLGGTNCVVDAACASSLAAIHLAGLELAAGLSDMVITGGVDTFNDIFMYMCFSKTPALSPTGDSKPFDADCDGTVLGEGLGMLVLKRLADAERDGDRIYAVLKGIGSSSDGRSSAIYAPRAGGQKLALQRAYAAAGVTPQSIDLLEAHGTGTKVGDATELSALTEVFGGAAGQPLPTAEQGAWCALGSVKSQIGHTKAAAGVAGIIKAAMALHHKVLPPTIKVQQPLEGAIAAQSPFYVNTKKRPWVARAAHPRRAGVSALGFGGTNFHCVLEEHAAAKATPDWDGDVELFALCGDSTAALIAQLDAQRGALAAGASWLDVRRAAHASRIEFRSDAQCRLVVVMTVQSDRAALLDSARTLLEKNAGKPVWTAPNGIAYGAGPAHGTLGALFPGQGSQYPGMLRDLACQFPGMLDTLTEADDAFAAAGGAPRLSDFIYPHPAFSDAARSAQDAALKATQVAQPALGAVSMGALKVLDYFGVGAAAACGHSYGELSALCGAGRIAPAALHQLSNLRGRLMARRSDGADRGAMVAVQADEATLARFMQEAGGDLVVANRNSPKQTVLAGSSEAIQRASAALTERSIRHRVLQVSAAFHSALVADARAPFAAALDGVTFNANALPVYANASGVAYPSSAADARALLASQIVQPVLFIDQIRAMHAAGVRTFVEVGPGHVLSDLVQSILPAGAAETIALDASGGARSGIFDLALALARLAALGHTIDLPRWENAPAPASARNGKPALTVAISGANYRAPHAVRPPAPPRAAPSVRAASSIQAAPAAFVPPQSMPMTPPAQPSSPSPSVSGAELPAALRAAQEGILALQRLQEQTAQLHKQFLEGQESARRAMMSLLGAQGGAPVGAHYAPAHSSAAPAPAMQSVAMPVPVVQQALAPVTDVSVVPAQTGAPASAGRSAIEQAVLGVVADKTGYPIEMLNLDMGMDADLGIDSIKRVEIMAALRGRLPQAPEIKPEHLGSLQTLEQVVAFLAAGSSVGVAAPAAASAAAPVAVQVIAPTGLSDATLASVGAGSARIVEVLLGVVADKTGYPAEMLDLNMGLDADLGIDSIKRVEIMAALRSQLPGAPEIKPEHLGALQTLQQIADFLAVGSQSSTQPAPHAAPAVPAQTAVISAAAAPATSSAHIADVLLAVVAEKTGYPVDMLSLDMGLDADLGIDSIKRVEIMAALRSQLPGAPEIKPEHLGSLQTLQQMVDFLAGPQGGSNPAAAVLSPVTSATSSALASSPGDISSAAVTAPAPVIARGAQQTVMRQVVRPVTLSPHEHRETLRLPAGAHVWLVDDGSPLAAHVETLLKAKRLSVQRGGVEHKFTGARAGKPNALLVLAPAAGCDERFLQRALQLMQQASPALRKAGASGESAALLVTVSRLDGRFGFGAMSERADPVSGGLAGLVKTARLEWPDVQCKAIDIDPVSMDTADAARQIVEEMLLAGPVEVGLSAAARYSLEVELEPLALLAAGAGAAMPAPLTARDVVLVSGGARGVTGDAALAMARQFGCTLVLLGRSALDAAEPAWAQGIEGEASLKKALFAQLPRGTSPAQVETQFRSLMAQREIRAQLARIEAVGARAQYCAVDVRDAAAVAGAVAQIRVQHGAIRGLVHGAGVLADRRIEDKTAEQFAAVYGTKVTGLHHLLDALAGDTLKVIALFSSYTGRFGRVGQVDYAAANEVLNKIAQAEARRRPASRVVSVNWGPWNGGMVTPGLRTLFEQEGVGLIETGAGAQFLVDELCAGSVGVNAARAHAAGAAMADVEVLALAPSPQSTPQALVPTLVPTLAPARNAATPVAVGATAVMAGAALKLHASVAFEREVSVAALPFLESHVINGRAVLPAALMVEWLAQAALHGNPGMRFHGLDDFKVLKGVVLDAGQTVTVSLRAAPGALRDKLHVVPVQMTSEVNGRAVLHAQADVLLSEEKLPPAPVAKKFDMHGGAIADAYSLGVLFHGVALHGIETVEVCAEKGVAALLKAASAPIKWMRNPLRGSWIADPLALDSAFQMMILWSNAHRGGPSLPSALGSYRQFVGAFPKGGCRAVIGVALGISAIAVATIQFLDRQGNLLASAEGCEFVVDAALHDAFRQNRLKLDT